MHAPYTSLPGRKIRLDEDQSLRILKNVLLLPEITPALRELYDGH
jgi:hypothetical protein